MPLNDLTSAAARLVVEDGLEYGAAKRKAARDLLRRHARASELPSNEAVEDSVREYLSVFMADTQPAELRALRRLALRWMERLADFRPHLAGAVWRGTATRRSVIQIELYCDDPKAAEIELLNQHADFAFAGHGAERHDVLALLEPSEELGQPVQLFLHVLDSDDLRGGLKPDAKGRTWRGDSSALATLLNVEPT
ncbi:MAG: hypothetical protein JNJ42_11560 [Burkholderiaceae bacterium]|jgi:hypothetical protein|nr:hypothetical protein [Burkholderiaceae bacterium]